MGDVTENLGGEKFKHVALSAAKGGLKGALWGAIGVGVLTAVSAALTVMTFGAGALISGLLAYGFTTIVGYAAAAGAGLGLLEGMSTTNMVEAEHIAISGKKAVQQEMIASVKQRQQQINAGAGMSVLSPHYLPPQQQQGMSPAMS
jgi:hypothetical protein